MKKKIAAIAMMGGAASSFANPGVMLGVTYNFGGHWGISLKVLSTDHQDRGAVAAGVTYFPTTRSWGADAGVAYLARSSAATFGWDFLHSQFQMGLGYVHTKADRAPAPVSGPTATPAAGGSVTPPTTPTAPTTIPAATRPGVLFGLSNDFGGNLGLGLKLLSTEHQDRGALEAGVTYFPTNKSWGADAGVAYLARDSAATIGWDFLHSKFQAGLGYVHTTHDETVPAAPAVVAAPSGGGA